MWLARDKHGFLELHEYVPKLCYGIWCNSESTIPLDRTQFPEVTFENSPVEVELTIKKK